MQSEFDANLRVRFTELRDNSTLAIPLDAGVSRTLMQSRLNVCRRSSSERRGKLIEPCDIA